AVSVRAAHKVLYEQHVVINRGREEQSRTVSLPTLFETLRAAHGAQALERFRPIRLRLAPLKVRARRFDHPRAVVLEIKLLTHAFEPLEEDLTRRLLLFVNLKLLVLRRQFTDERAARGVRRLAAFYAVNCDARVPALRRFAVWAVRVFFFRRFEEGALRISRREFFDRRRVATDFVVGRARRESQLFCEESEDAREAERRRVPSDRAGGEFREVEHVLRAPFLRRFDLLRFDFF